MGFGGEVHDRVDPMLAQQRADQPAIADVAMDEDMPGFGIEVGQAGDDFPRRSACRG